MSNPLSDDKMIADIEACHAAHASWWAIERECGWAKEADPFALRIAFTAGWHSRRRNSASADTLPKGGDAKQAPCASKGSAVGNAETPETPHGIR